MRPQAINSTIGAAFGAVFVVVNSGFLHAPVAVALRVVAIAALVAVVVRARVLRGDQPRSRSAYGRPYLIVVAAEVVVLVAGIPVVRSAIGGDAVVAWIALVVGLHFFGLAAVWHEVRFALLAVPVTACGAIGLALAAGSASTGVVKTVSGIVPGFVLLAFALQQVVLAAGRRSAGQAQPS